MQSGRYALGFSLQALERLSEARAEYEKSIELQTLQTESYYPDIAVKPCPSGGRNEEYSSQH